MDKYSNDRESLMKEIMAMDFTLYDLNLYLDTHPCDGRALMLYNLSVQRALMLKSMYQNMYGPIIQNCFTSTCPWQWIESPWPWQKGV